MKIVQCWDDGVEDDIRLCELLRSIGAQATFNLNAGLHGAVRGPAWQFKGIKDVRKLAIDELPQVYEGFEIANHTLTHPSPEKFRRRSGSVRSWRAARASRICSAKE